MPKKCDKQKQQEDGTTVAEKPTQKRALAEAIRCLGPSASHSALAGFVKDQFGMELTFCILVPKAGTTKKPEVQSKPRARCA